MRWAALTLRNVWVGMLRDPKGGWHKGRLDALRQLNPRFGGNQSSGQRLGSKDLETRLGAMSWSQAGPHSWF